MNEGRVVLRPIPPKCYALNHDYQMSRSCLNMRSSIQNYKDELMNELSFLHVPSEIGHK